MRNLSSRVHRSQRHRTGPSGIRRGWEALGEMTIRTTFKQLIGGATGKKGQPEWTTHIPLVESVVSAELSANPYVSCLPDSGLRNSCDELVPIDRQPAKPA